MPLFVTASAVETATYQERGDVQDDVVDKLQGIFTTLSPERFPNLARHGEDMVSGDGDERFRFGDRHLPRRARRARGRAR